MDLQYAKKQFENYLDHYDRKNDKVKLKIVHTYGVVECSRQISERLGLSKEDKDLAQIIALLHDIGRFEQIKRFNSFEADVMDHAAFGVSILFEEGMIREFVKENTWDEVIKTAIAKHSDFKLEEIDDERTYLHAKLIRDADKLDNCRVKIVDTVESMIDISEQELGGLKISPQIMEQFLKKESIFSPMRKTKMDYWISYVAYFYDVNFPETLEIVREKRYAERIIDRIHYTDPDTAEKMKMIRETIIRDIEQRIKR